MKLALSCLLALTLCAAGEEAPLTAHLEVKTDVARNHRNTSWLTDYGSYNRQYTREVSLAVSITSVATRKTFPAVLEWYVLGKPVLTGGKRSVVAQGTQAVLVDPVSGTKLEVSSGPITAVDNRYYAINERQTSGSRIEGWFCRLADQGGRELAAVASDPGTLPWCGENCRAGEPRSRARMTPIPTASPFIKPAPAPIEAVVLDGVPDKIASQIWVTAQRAAPGNAERQFEYYRALIASWKKRNNVAVSSPIP